MALAAMGQQNLAGGNPTVSATPSTHVSNRAAVVQQFPPVAQLNRSWCVFPELFVFSRFLCFRRRVPEAGREDVGHLV